MPTDLWKERYLPYVCGGVAGIVALAIMWHLGVPDLSRAVPASAMTLGIVIASFAATQRNMLVGVGFPRRLRRTLNAGYLDDILSYFQQAITLGVVMTFISLLGLFVIDIDFLCLTWMVATSVLITIIGVAMFRNERIMFIVVKQVVKAQLSPENQNEPVIKRSDR